jgi:acetyl esterase/lipase
MAQPAGGRVAIEEGVVFGKGGGRELRCDVFTPPADVRNRRGVLLVHGGGWRQGDRSQLRGYGVLLGRRGYTLVACEYRLSGEAKWPAQIHDVKAALRWMRAESGALGIDPARIAISGNSAGGHLALVAAGTPNLPAFEGMGGNEGTGTEVAAAIAFYPPVTLAPDPSRLATNPGLRAALEELFGTDFEHEVARQASPLTHAHGAFPPTLLIHGNRDELVPAEESFRMYRALAEVGAEVELHMFNGVPHAFDAGRELGRQCADIMTLFLDRHVPAP